MSKLSDPEFLLSDQYKDASNLDARIQLHRGFSTNTYGWLRWVFDQFDLPPVCRVLDLGCGPANLWVENLGRVPAGWEITLTDFSPGMVDKAQENLSNSGRPFAFEIVDAQSIPYDDASFDAVGGFDAVIANHMLYHVPDRGKALAEMRRALRPGGRLYTSTVGEMHMQELFDLVGKFDSEGKLKSARGTNPFTLESGLPQVERWFTGVVTHRYEDDLIVEEAEALIAYILSLADAQTVFAGDRLKELAEYVEQEIAARGAIHITKDSGMFEATKGATAD
jgi:SAM-dependent methyltransferase